MYEHHSYALRPASHFAIIARQAFLILGVLRRVSHSNVQLLVPTVTSSSWEDDLAEILQLFHLDQDLRVVTGQLSPLPRPKFLNGASWFFTRR